MNSNQVDTTQIVLDTLAQGITCFQAGDRVGGVAHLLYALLVLLAS